MILGDMDFQLSTNMMVIISTILILLVVSYWWFSPLLTPLTGTGGAKFFWCSSDGYCLMDLIRLGSTDNKCQHLKSIFIGGELKIELKINILLRNCNHDDHLTVPKAFWICWLIFSDIALAASIQLPQLPGWGFQSRLLFDLCDHLINV